MENIIGDKEKIKISKTNKWSIIFKFFFIFFLIIYIIKNDSQKKINKSSLDILIYKLNKYYVKRKPRYILLFDYVSNKFCYDHNSYLLFQYYQKINKTNVFYIINPESDLYNSLLLKNKTNNLILLNPNEENYLDHLYPYLLNSKIMIHSYMIPEFLKLINRVNYLKYLKINHGIRYFKNNKDNELSMLNKGKRNSIISSPYEYDIYKNKFNFLNEEMHKAGLPRFDRFNEIKKNKTEKECILIFFTYRSYDEEYYNISLLKKNIIQLLEDKTLISFLKKKNIDLIYIQHHFDIKRNRTFEFNNFSYIKYKKQTFLKHYIEQCSLLVTDFSSISFDFIFQNKPSLFYLLDYNETFNYKEKNILKEFPKSPFVLNNTFYNQTSLIKKILFYVENKFKIEEDLKKEYENVFYYKKNIAKRIIEIIDNII